MSKGIAKTTNLTTSGLVAHNTAGNWDFLYEASTVKNPNYNIGDRVVLPDGRAFRYAKAGANFGSMKTACCTYNHLVCEYSTRTAVLTSASVVGDKSITLTVTAGEIGVNEDGVIAEDELRGGYITIYGSSTYRPTRGIIGNTALAADGTSITIYLDAALTTVCAASSVTQILANPYNDVRASNATSGMSGWLGIPNVLATSGQYFWIQTWGLARVTPIAAAIGDQRANQLVFAANGGVRSHVASVALADVSEQHCGFLMESYAGEEQEYAAPFVNLQINP